MKIGITAPVFIKNQEHLKYLNLTTQSIISLDHDIVWLPVENFINPELVPLPYKFNHEPEDIVILKGRQPQGVSKAWNDGIAKAAELGCDYVIVINTDIVFKSNAIDRLVAFAETFKCDKCANGWELGSFDVPCRLCGWTGSKNKSVMWTCSEYSDLALLEECPEDENFSEHPHFSCFMVKPKEFIEKFGKFDENFLPAYLEDGDAHARMALQDYKAYIYGGAKFFHFGSRVIKSDAEEWDKNRVSFPQNQQYFLDKWGHPPVNEVSRMREVYFKHPYNEDDKPLNYWKGQDD